MRIGVLMMPTDDWDRTASTARWVGELGYDHLWVDDHLSWQRYRDRPWHATSPWLAGIAATTSVIRLGTMVSNPNVRHPVGLAKDAMTILDDLLTGELQDHEGQWYGFREARILPGCVQRPRLPLAIAGGGPRAIEIAAAHGDAWITYGDTTRSTSSATPRPVPPSRRLPGDGGRRTVRS